MQCVAKSNEILVEPSEKLTHFPNHALNFLFFSVNFPEQSEELDQPQNLSSWKFYHMSQLEKPLISQSLAINKNLILGNILNNVTTWHTHPV